MRYPCAVLLVGACLLTSAQRAAATAESRAAVLFLLIEPGARAHAMGESYVAIADDGTASYFNPAALSGQVGRKLNMTYMKWLPGLADDLSYSFVGYAQPVEGWGNIGLNFGILNLGEQTRTDERGNELGHFRSYDMAFSVAYGADIADNLTAGVGLKYIYSHLADQGAGRERGSGVASSFAADIGLLWHATPDLTFGAALRNMGPKMAYIDASQADPLPQHVVVGAGYELLETQYHSVLLSLDVYKPLIADGSFASNLVKSWTDDPLADEVKEMDLHVGGEYKYGLSSRLEDAFLALRGGYSLDHDGDLKLFTTGLGLKYTRFQIDVAYILGNDTPMDDNTRFSLNLNF
ncbi:MAG: PorV/PorQ family protein [Candidatus Latescibacterota bacterium]